VVRNLIVSGGVGHPFADTSDLLAALLDDAGITSEIVTDVDAALASLGRPGGPGLLTLNALRWRMTAE
jgi:hypothetical protein